MRLNTSFRRGLGLAQGLLGSRGRRGGSATAAGKALKLQGLQGPVEVLTDDYGVPHIYADTVADLFFAQGFVTARDRLFQIDYNRHAARGRLCEMLGRRPVPWQRLSVHLKERSTYDVDVFVRAFGMERAAKDSLALHSAQAREILDAYAAGVNAYIATGVRPLEHLILRWKAPQWTSLDSLVLVKSMGFELNFAWRAILLGAMLGQARVPEDVARQLWPHFPEDGTPIVDAEAWARMASELAATRDAAAVAGMGLGNASGVGSNCFAVAGSHTQSGDALLANDPHLSLVAPTPWHEVGLHGAGFELNGFALPGVPGVGVGQTPHHAWGITAALVHDLDLFAERLHPDDPGRYLTPDGWQRLFVHHETFKVRGEDEVHERKVLESRHGPLVETLATQPDTGDQRFAVCWTGHRPSRELDALLALWQSKNLAECRRGLEHHVCPTFNITYAGAGGEVAYIMAGAIPKRRTNTPLRPLEGWTGEWDWDDALVPVELNPTDVNPERGFVVTANNRVGPADFPYELGDLFEPSERYDRIVERLQACGKQVTMDDLISIQNDTQSRWGVRSRDVLLAVVGGAHGVAPQSGTVERYAAQLWEEWDGEAGRDSPGAAVALMTAFNTGREVVRRLAGEDAARAFVEMASFVCESIERLPQLQERLDALGVDLADAIRAAFARTVKACRKAMGSDPAVWRWGAMHRLVGRHRLHDLPVVGAFFDLGPEPADGGPDTVNRGDIEGASSFDIKVGVSLRFVANAAKPDLARAVMPGGQSGDRLSPHYDDQLPLFLAGVLKASPATRTASAAAAVERFEPKT